jgi:hypothetical protein
MAVTPIYEVRQRTPGDSNVSRELGNFTDLGIARQTIDWLYREVYKRVMAKDFFPDEWVPDGVRSTINANGFDRWLVDDFNGAFPMFYVVEHKLYNQVPVVNGTFTFTVSPTPFDTFTPVP